MLTCMGQYTQIRAWKAMHPSNSKSGNETMSCLPDFIYVRLRGIVWLWLRFTVDNFCEWNLNSSTLYMNSSAWWTCVFWELLSELMTQTRQTMVGLFCIVMKTYTWPVHAIGVIAWLPASIPIQHSILQVYIKLHKDSLLWNHLLYQLYNYARVMWYLPLQIVHGSVVNGFLIWWIKGMNMMKMDRQR